MIHYFEGKKYKIPREFPLNAHVSITFLHLIGWSTWTRGMKGPANLHSGPVFVCIFLGSTITPGLACSQNPQS